MFFFFLVRVCVQSEDVIIFEEISEIFLSLSCDHQDLFLSLIISSMSYASLLDELFQRWMNMLSVVSCYNGEFTQVCSFIFYTFIYFQQKETCFLT